MDAINPRHKLSTEKSHTDRGIFETGTAPAEAEIKRFEAQCKFD
jgi:hypothetical protein